MKNNEILSKLRLQGSRWEDEKGNEGWCKKKVRWGNRGREYFLFEVYFFFLLIRVKFFEIFIQNFGIGR